MGRAATAHRIGMRVDFLRMSKTAGRATKGGLTPEQSTRLRKAILDRLLPRYDGNVSKLAKALEAGQPNIQRFLYKGAGSSIQVAAKTAELLREDINDLLGLVRVPALTLERDDEQPNRPEAMAILRRMGIKEDVIDQLRKNPGSRAGEVVPLKFLVELGLLYDRQGARTGTRGWRSRI